MPIELFVQTSTNILQLSQVRREGREVLILIGSNENHFEPADISIPATNEDGLLAMKDEIEQILSIIDQLELIDKRRVREAEAQELAS